LLLFPIDIDLCRLLHLMSSLLVLCYKFLYLVSVGSRKFGDLFEILNEDESRHAGNVVLGCNLFIVIHVNLEKNDVRELLRHIFQFWSNHFAGSTPRGVKVHDHELVRSVLQLRSEVVHIFDHVYKRHVDDVGFFGQGPFLNSFSSTKKQQTTSENKSNQKEDKKATSSVNNTEGETKSSEAEKGA